MGRLGSGVFVSAIFQIFASTAGRNVTGGREYVREEMSYTLVIASTGVDSTDCLPTHHCIVTCDYAVFAKTKFNLYIAYITYVNNLQQVVKVIGAVSGSRVMYPNFLLDS